MILVTGARGMLGTDLCEVLRAQGQPLVAVDLPELDLTDRDATRAFVRDCAPSVVINCAAYTAVDQAETDPDTAFRVNRDGARNLAQAAAGAALLHLSTDYVFDGTKDGPYVEEDTPNPRSVYGASKLAGEIAVRETLAEHWIVRTAWLYGVHGKSFPRTMLELAHKGGPLRIVNDQRGGPTYTVHLAEALAKIVAQPRYGTYHAVNSGSCTWYDLARAVLAEAGITVEVQPVSTSAFPRPAPRPASSVLDTSRLAAVYGIKLPGWEEGVREFVAAWRRE
jgi:dTDP-4-dehydrorhamnose reductase